MREVEAELEQSKNKAESWDYYQELIRGNGLNGITDLLAKHREAQDILAEREQLLAQNSPEPIRGDCYEAGLWSMRNVEALVKDGNFVGAVPVQQAASASDYEEVLADHRKLVRDLDVLLNGESIAAKQASLCDLVAQVAQIVREDGAPLLQPSSALLFSGSHGHAGYLIDEQSSPAVEMPKKRFTPGFSLSNYQEVSGWNKCVEAFFAQQSPAVAVRDGIELAANYIDALAEKQERAWDSYLKSGATGKATSFHGLYRGLAKEVRALSTAPKPETISSKTSEWSPRITEQDAREAVEKLDHVLKMNKNVMTNTGVVYIQQCRALLNKLNDKPESNPNPSNICQVCQGSFKPDSNKIYKVFGADEVREIEFTDGGEAPEVDKPEIPTGWYITHNPKPIPDRSHDYDFVHDNYDGADGGNGLCGTAKSFTDAIAQIKEIELDNPESVGG